jgi:hypothetical protein
MTDLNRIKQLAGISNITEDKIELALRGPKDAKISHNGEQYTNFEMINKFRSGSKYGDVIRFSCTRLRDGESCEIDIAGDHVLKVTCDSDTNDEYAAMNVKTGDYADYYTRNDIKDERDRFTHVMTQAKFDDFESKYSVEDMVGLSDDELKKLGWMALRK